MTAVGTRRGVSPQLAVDLSEVDAAYLAGLIDADGTIGLYRKKRNGAPCYVLTLGISNTRNDLLAWVQRTTSAGFIVTQKRETATHKAAYQWLAHNRVAWSVLQQTMPYMRVKEDRAALAKNALDALLDHDYEKVEEFRLLFSLANQRGPR